MKRVGRHTHVEAIDEQKRASMARNLALCLGHLKWRWHGIGLLQAYLYEGFSVEERVHIWAPELMLPGIAESGSAHDHRFDLASTVIVGALKHTEWLLTSNKLGGHETYDFVHAREQTDENRAAMRSTGDRFCVAKDNFEFHAGDRYTFARGAFHSSEPLSDVVVTLVEKTRQTETKARVVAPVDRAPVPAFSAELTEEMLETALNRAINALEAGAEGAT